MFGKYEISYIIFFCYQRYTNGYFNAIITKSFGCIIGILFWLFLRKPLPNKHDSFESLPTFKVTRSFLLRRLLCAFCSHFFHVSILTDNIRICLVEEYYAMPLTPRGNAVTLVLMKQLDCVQFIGSEYSEHE